MTESGIDWSAVPFRKSSCSNTNGGQCVEVGWADVQFRKSSYSSSTTGGQCVEVGARRGVVGVRDSKNPAGGVLAMPATAWAMFTERVKP